MFFDNKKIVIKIVNNASYWLALLALYFTVTV
jgi:hypothetical protein